MKIEELLLSWDEYNKKEFSVPHFFDIQKDNQLLIYCGVRHTYKQDDAQFEELHKKWDLFLKNSNPNKIAIGEGGVRKPSNNLEEAIRHYGEQGWLRFVADASGMEVISPDITDIRLWNALLDKYSKEELFYYDIMQIAYQWNKTNKEIPFDKYIKQFTADFIKNWTNFDTSWENILKIHRELFQTEFDPNNYKFFHDTINPAEKTTKFNQLSRDADVIRDSSVVSEIKRLWDEGKSVFVVFGSGHAIIQEPALKTLLK